MTVKVEVPGPGYAAQVAHPQFEKVRLSLDQAALSEMRARLMQQLRDLPPVPAALREPAANTP